MLGDEYIAQHITQGYREHLEQTSYKVYMSNMASSIVSLLSGTQLETRWSDILHDLDESVSYTPKQTENEAEIRNRILEKLRREGNPNECI